MAVAGLLLMAMALAATLPESCSQGPERNNQKQNAVTVSKGKPMPETQHVHPAVPENKWIASLLRSLKLITKRMKAPHQESLNENREDAATSELSHPVTGMTNNLTKNLKVDRLVQELRSLSSELNAKQSNIKKRIPTKSAMAKQMSTGSLYFGPWNTERNSFKSRFQFEAIANGSSTARRKSNPSELKTLKHKRPSFKEDHQRNEIRRLYWRLRSKLPRMRHHNIEQAIGALQAPSTEASILRRHLGARLQRQLRDGCVVIVSDNVLRSHFPQESRK